MKLKKNAMKLKKPFNFTKLSLIPISSFLTLSTAFAADGEWDTNADGDWSTAANWSGTIIADGTDNTATFGNAINSNRTITLDSDRTIGNIIASDTSHNYTISGANILTLDRTTGIPIIDVTRDGRELTISSEIAGNDGLQKDGDGRVLLTGTNTYTGGTIINAGRLGSGSDAALGAAAGSITLNGGDLYIQQSQTAARELILNNVAGNNVLIQGNRDWVNSGAITGDGGVSFITTGNGVNTATFTSQSNSFNGALGISGKRIRISLNSMADSATANGNIVFGNGSGEQLFNWGSGAGSALTLANRSIEFANNGGAQGTIRNSSITNAITISTDLVVSGTGAKNLILDAVSGTTNVFAGNIADGSGTVALTKTGTGVWDLEGVNTYTGDTFVDRGTLNLSTNAELLFVIGALGGENNAILGDATNATVNLDGLFRFNLTDASTTVSDFWNIVDVGNLAETYGSTFDVASTNGAFTETALDSGIWTLDEGGATYEFTQSTGMLTVIPEPSAALLGALGFLALLRRRR